MLHSTTTLLAIIKKITKKKQKKNYVIKLNYLTSRQMPAIY